MRGENHIGNFSCSNFIRNVLPRCGKSNIFNGSAWNYMQTRKPKKFKKILTNHSKKIILMDFFKSRSINPTKSFQFFLPLTSLIIAFLISHHTFFSSQLVSLLFRHKWFPFCGMVRSISALTFSFLPPLYFSFILLHSPQYITPQLPSIYMWIWALLWNIIRKLALMKEKMNREKSNKLIIDFCIIGWFIDILMT